MTNGSKPQDSKPTSSSSGGKGQDQGTKLPGTTSITFPGVPADVLIANVPEVCFSNGSACTSGAVAPSHVLLAMGLSREYADCTIRLSVGRQTTANDVSVAVTYIAEAISRLRTKAS